jgi:multidrug efflux pump subunit AcrB
MSMAMTIIFGLAFGTVLTMVMIPTFHAALHRIEPPSN